MKIALVGSGNVATVMGKIIKKAGHKIVKVISRNESKACFLASELDSEAGNFHSAPYDVDMYIIAITDTALYHLDQQINFGEKVVVHTAGSVSKEVLKNMSSHYGILYPLQSLTKNAVEIPEIPLMVDGNSPETISFIQSFAKTISPNVTIAGDEQRMKYHIAGVLVSNFTNHLFAVTNTFCRKENIDFRKLLPLIKETTSRIEQNDPELVQTGPAAREDIRTLSKHLEVLSAHPELKDLYLRLTESIQKLHHARL